MFNQEYKITWDEIAPSLQELFMNLQEEISDNHNRIVKNKMSLDSVEEKIKEIEDFDRLEDIVSSALDGQVIKVDTKRNKIYTSDGFLTLNVFSRPSDLELAKKVKPSFYKDANTNWKRFAHYDTATLIELDSNQTNSPNISEGQNLNNPTYNEFTGSPSSIQISDAGEITCTTTSPLVASVYSSKEYSKYTVSYNINTKRADSIVGILIGYTIDKHGKEHTLSVIRSPKISGYTNLINFALVYDLGNPSQLVLKDYTNKVTDNITNTTLNDYHVFLKVERNVDDFAFYTSIFSETSATSVSQYVGEYSFSRRGITDKEVLANLKDMALCPSRIGIVFRNTGVDFIPIDQKGLRNNENIYDIDNNTCYTYNYNTNTWVAEGELDESLETKVFLYNKNTREFYFYYGEGNYQEIALFHNALFDKAKQGQVIKLNTDTRRVFADDNFRVLYAVTTEEDLNKIKTELENNLYQRENIYDFTSGNVLKYSMVSNSWVVESQIRSTLPERIMIYNNRLKKLFWYADGRATYIEY